MIKPDYCTSCGWFGVLSKWTDAFGRPFICYVCITDPPSRKPAVVQSGCLIAHEHKQP
jgi:hypothetical protein